MRWVKIAIYLFTYIVLFYSANWIFISWYESITNMFGAAQTAWQLSNVASIMVEVIAMALVLILFFIPIWWKNWRSSINIHYYVDRAQDAIEGVMQNNNESEDVRKQKLASLLYNWLIYGVILIAYIILLSIISWIPNWLQLLYYLVFSYIVISVVDFLTWIVQKIDLAEWNSSDSDFLSKKNIMTWSIIFFIFLFLYLWTPMVEKLHTETKDLPILNIFDGTRIHVDNVN